MSKKVGFIHTGVPIGALFRQLLKKRLPDIQAFHIVDESLLQDLLEAGELTPQILKRLCSQVALAREAGADLIMVTCSSIGPGVEVARRLVDVDVLRIDEPMAEKAVDMAGRVGVLATAKSTLVPSVDLIKSTAQLKGKHVEVDSVLCDEAFSSFLRGDLSGHDRLVKEAGVELAERSDVLVLAQASMSHLADQIESATNVPVLTSPALAFDATESLLKSA